MASKTAFPLEDAKQAERENRLLEWVLQYLRDEALNKGLAKMIEATPCDCVRIQDIALSRLSRIIGPERGMMYPEDSEVFEKRVGILLDALKRGEIFPPLVLTDFWKLGTIQDGSHRHEALVRYGFKTYPAIVCFAKKESLEFFS